VRSCEPWYVTLIARNRIPGVCPANAQKAAKIAPPPTTAIADSTTTETTDSGLPKMAAMIEAKTPDSRE
jgi:hypothetical protein